MDKTDKIKTNDVKKKPMFKARSVLDNYDEPMWAQKQTTGFRPGSDIFYGQDNTSPKADYDPGRMLENLVVRRRAGGVSIAMKDLKPILASRRPQFK